MELIQIFSIVVLIFSIVLHEIAHGYAALLCGDPTAKISGRLTLNPVKHLDFVGSLIVPIVFFFASSGVAGWAKPVPYNPYLLQGRFAELFVASAGVLTNLLIALCIAFALSIGILTPSQEAFELITAIVYINIGLFVFNLLPFPPFDGLRIITSLFHSLGVARRHFMIFEQPFWIFISLLIAFNLSPFIASIVSFIVAHIL